MNRITTRFKVSRQRKSVAPTNDKLVDTGEENDAIHDAIKLGSRIVLCDVLSKKSTRRAVVMELLPNRKYTIYWVGHAVSKKLSVVPTVTTPSNAVVTVNQLQQKYASGACVYRYTFILYLKPVHMCQSLTKTEPNEKMRSRENLKRETCMSNSTTTQQHQTLVDFNCVHMFPLKIFCLCFTWLVFC
jgi:hypothetical protein